MHDKSMILHFASNSIHQVTKRRTAMRRRGEQQSTPGCLVPTPCRSPPTTPQAGLATGGQSKTNKSPPAEDQAGPCLYPNR